MIAAGDEDGNDASNLRIDPMFKMALDLAPSGTGALCSQPTISRLENLSDTRALLRTGRAMVDCIARVSAPCPSALSSTGAGREGTISFWASRLLRHCAAISPVSKPAPRRASMLYPAMARRAASRHSTTVPKAGAAVADGIGRSSPASKLAIRVPTRACPTRAFPHALYCHQSQEGLALLAL